jgi:hypothetical protein
MNSLKSIEKNAGMLTVHKSLRQCATAPVSDFSVVAARPAYFLPIASGFKTLLGLPAANATISSTTTA